MRQMQPESCRQILGPVLHTYKGVERGWGEGLQSVGRGALRAQVLRMSSAECAALCGSAGALPAS